MKVLLINGSPKTERCTFTALSEVAKTLEAEGIEKRKSSISAIRQSAAALTAVPAKRTANAFLTIL